MKYDVKMSCGHMDTVELFGNGRERERKLAYFEEQGLCKTCYQRKREKETQRLGLRIHYTLTTAYDESVPERALVCLWFGGDTLPSKESIKQLGYRWGECVVIRGDSLCWHKIVEENCLTEELRKAVKIGATIMPPNESAQVLARSCNKERLGKQKAIQNEIDKLNKPVPPAFIGGATWNKKVYGKPGSFSVYPNGSRTTITDEQKERLDEYLVAQEAYLKAVEEIKKK